ncbi:ABC transporter permease [Protaetiibacter intestinalis]|uniref:ABC transporter permease n=1 Tax=Protaetiibacter intestinalis TaxID=2419774 RepID=A0A387B863_9MICO|nr:ABC transporter permease [Protaetiibacter intestinalis]AYF97938.1 ABC transporter permease [Protaetiibacter intestinalis]
MNAARTPAVARPYSTGRTVWLVAQREIMVRLRSVAFLVSTGILLLLLVGSVVVGALTSLNAEAPKVAVVAGVELPADSGLTVTEVADRAAAEKLVRAGDVDAAIIPDDGPLGYVVLGDDSPPLGVVQALSVAPPVELLDTSGTGGFLGYLVAIGFGLVFFISAMTFGQTIAQSVVEEKQTRVVEILLATIPTRALLAGKILGTTILALGQITLLLSLAIIGLTVTGQGELLTGLGLPFVWFAIFFVLGFALLASLFAATGAMVSRQEDIGSTTTPVTMLVMIPYFVVVFFNDNDLVVKIMSYVPFSAPVGMPLRLFLGTAEWWEPLLSLAILVATCVAVIALGARIYENSLLRIGTRVKLAEALRG